MVSQRTYDTALVTSCVICLELYALGRTFAKLLVKVYEVVVLALDRHHCFVGV